MTTASLGDMRGATAIARHWIDGRWSDSAEHEDSINPANGEVIGRYAVAGEDEAREATTVALRTFRETTWKNDRALRSRVLNEMAERFEARAADLIQLMCIEVGKVVPDATFEVGTAAPALRFCAALVCTEYGRVAEWEPGHFSLLVRDPIGVAGISVPWNAPVALLIRSLAPALAAGCTTVVKMPGQTAQLNALIGQVIGEVTSLPRGVVNIVTGGREVLNFLVTSPDVPTISFTGSTRVGRAISQAGAARLKRFGLELGGKTPMLVFDDADVDAALPKLEKAVTVFAGQFCMTGSRLLVQSGIADRVRQHLAARLSNVKVGPASDPTSDMHTGRQSIFTIVRQRERFRLGVEHLHREDRSEDLFLDDLHARIHRLEECRPIEGAPGERSLGHWTTHAARAMAVSVVDQFAVGVGSARRPVLPGR
jgi:acyl-CoA reductase-like NAD-dependent aldehyde dehydrogenase